MNETAWFGTAFLYSLFFSWVALRRPTMLARPLVKPLVLAGFLALVVIMIFEMQASSGNPFGEGPFFLLAIAVLSLSFAPYLVILVAEYFDLLHQWGSGIGSMKIENSYDQAEKWEREGMKEKALGLYVSEAEKDAGDVEARRRAAELSWKLGRREDAILWFKAAIKTTDSPESEVPLTFRLTEIFLQNADTRKEAILHLEKVCNNHKGTKFAEYARERLDRIGVPPV